MLVIGELMENLMNNDGQVPPHPSGGKKRKKINMRSTSALREHSLLLRVGGWGPMP